jgi:hypothetical protein
MSEGPILCLPTCGFDLGGPGHVTTARNCVPAELGSRVDIPFGSSLLPIEIDEGMNVWAPH